jgi:hypothetical protein
LGSSALERRRRMKLDMEIYVSTITWDGASPQIKTSSMKIELQFRTHMFG